MLQKIDSNLWTTSQFKTRVKLSASFKWNFYGRRFTNFKVYCHPERKDYYRNKKTRDLCEGYWVHAYLDSIDDAGMSAWKYCETVDETKAMLKHARSILSKLPKGGISQEFFRDHFKIFDRVELW